MKKNDITVFRKKDIKDLEKIVSEKKVEAHETYSKMKSGRENNMKKYRNMRNEIAQILTIIREKEIISDLEKESK